MTEIGYSLRRAAADATKVVALIEATCGHYVERSGGLLRPMTEIYAKVIADRRTAVAESHGNISGVIALTVGGEGRNSKRLSSILQRPKL